MIRIGVFGYGNLGRGVLDAISQNEDLQAVAVFTRRNPNSIRLEYPEIPVISADDASQYKDKIDVMILCGGSATDLPVQGPEVARYFNIIDSFDTHAKVSEHFERMDEVLRKSGKIGIISVGWDPGLFSINRLYMSSILPEGKDYTFWGKGVSQGHSDAVRRIKGVVKAVQYTVPIEETVDRIRKGEKADFTPRQRHKRVCYVVKADNADAERIRDEIINMPYYFSDYDTTVNFITEEEFDSRHSGLPHGGFVLRNGTTKGGNNHIMEFSIKLDSNPQFTASVLVAYARAAYRLYKNKEIGCRTVFDIPPALLSPKDYMTIIKEML